MRVFQFGRWSRKTDSPEQTTLTVSEPRDDGHHHCSLRSGRAERGTSPMMSKVTKRLETTFTSWLSDQELAVIIGLVVLIFVSWGIYPFLAR
jgi:hypothetical protein